MEKVLSIIIPTYNMEKFLNRCLNSLIVKNMHLLEVLIINDGSKDSSSIIAHEYENKYPHTFKVIDKENGNYGSCINRGLKELTGKYVKILDADDWYITEELEKLLFSLEYTKSDIIFTSYTTRNYENQVKKQTKIPKQYIGKEYCINDFSFEENGLAAIRKMHCMCVNSMILKKNGYNQTEGISYTDTQFVFYSFLYGKTLTFYDYDIYQYCLGRDGQTMSIASMAKNNMHFYINAHKMLLDYTKISDNTSSNLVRNLQSCILSEIICYANVLFSHQYSKKGLELLKGLQTIGNQSLIPFNIYNRLKFDKGFYVWWKFGISPRIIILGRKIIRRLFP